MEGLTASVQELRHTAKGGIPGRPVCLPDPCIMSSRGVRWVVDWLGSTCCSAGAACLHMSQAAQAQLQGLELVST